MKKRGVIELQFNWIFVLIAGAIIFIFFMNIVNKQREFSNIKTAGTIITSLDSILTGAQISTDTVNIIDMPKADIGFECNRYFIGPVPKQIQRNIIFSPNLLKGNKIITWTLDWNLPYRVTNFLYLTNPKVRYIIVNNSDNLGPKLYNELPKEINKELIDKSELTDLIDKNNYKVKFIFLNNVDDNALLKFKRMPDEEVTAINLIDIENLNVIPLTGTIEFLQKNEDEWQSVGTTYYLKIESLFGAIFAADLDTYNCVMKKAFKKLNLVTKIYLKRSEDLRDYYGIENIGCANAHSKAISNLENMEVASKSRIKDFPEELNHMEAMQNYAKNIGGNQESANYRAQLLSCALIY